MAFIPTPDCIRASIRQNLFGQDVVNTLWFSITGGGIGEVMLTDLANQLGLFWNVNFAPLYTSEMNLVDITCTDQDSSTAPSVTVPIVDNGQAIGPAAPGNVCFTIKFNTNQRGRSGRGRNYISGLREASITGNQLSQASADGWVDAYDLLRSAPLLSGLALWSVVSHYTNGAPRAAGFKQLITSVGYADLNLDSQRRRLTGRGS